MKPLCQEQGRSENPKNKTAHSTPFWFFLWCAQLCFARSGSKIVTETSCALMVSRAAIHHNPYMLLIAISTNVIFSHLSEPLSIPGFSFSWLRRREREVEAWTDRTLPEIKTKSRGDWRELIKRAWKRGYEDDTWWMIMKTETWWKVGVEIFWKKLCVKATVWKQACA